MSSTAAGVVTFIFTDLVGSTALIDRLGDDAADKVRRDHFEVLRRAVEDAGGEEVKNLGDGLMVSFASPVAALACAVAMQRALAESELHIRVGVHAGEPSHEGADYFGTPVVVAKRLCDRADGGQILTTELLAGLVGSRGGFRFLPRGRLILKGLSEPVAAVEVGWRPPEGAGSGVSPEPLRRRPRSIRSRGPGIVGRDRQLGILDDELEGALGGELRCVLVSGEAGVGKTRLVREFLARHDEVTALSARAHPMGNTTAFGLWAEALDGHLRHLPAGAVARFCGGFTEDLAAILRSVAAVRGSRPAGAPPRSALLEGITVLLENLADDAPVVVVLDDIHQADGSSLDALSYLATNLDGAPVLVVVAARPGELAEHPLANRVLLPLEQDGILSRLPVEPLDEDDLRALAASVLKVAPSPALVSWLQARTRGNPLFALGLVRALLEEGADLAAPRLRRLPEDLAERVRALLATLDAGALTVLEVLAVLGRPATIEELGVLTAKADDDLAVRLDELIRARTATEEERFGEPAFAVSHPLVQETIYASIGTPRRRLIHREIARALLAAGRPAEAAPHFSRSATRGDAEAIEALALALREAEERRAFREALATLAGLVEILPEGDQRWLDVGQALSSDREWAQYPLASRSDAELAIRALRAIDAALARSNDRRRRGILKLRLTHLLCWGTGNALEGERAATEAAALFAAAGDTGMVLHARHETAWARTLGGGDLASHAAEAIEVAKDAAAAGDKFLEMLALGAAANALVQSGRSSEAESIMRRAIALGSDGFRRPPTQLRAILATGLGFHGRLAEAREEFAAARRDDPDFADSSLLELGAVTWGVTGDIRRTLAWTEETITRNPGPLMAQRAVAHPFAALMAAEAGDTALARRYAGSARSAFEGNWMHVLLAVEAVLARLDLVEGSGAGDERAGSAGGALERLASAATLIHRRLRGLAGPFLLDLAEFAALAGDAERARRSAAMLAETADLTGSAMHAGTAALGSGWAAFAAGAFDSATGAVREAIAILDGLELPLFQGRAYELLGLALAAAETSGAADAFRQAAARFEACGATWRRDRALTELEPL